MVARLVISPVVPEIVDMFDSSTGVLGLALTGLWMAYAFAQFPSGVLADRYGERIIILAAIGLTTVASTLFSAHRGTCPDCNEQFERLSMHWRGTCGPPTMTRAQRELIAGLLLGHVGGNGANKISAL